MQGLFTPLLPSVGKQGLFTPLLPAGELFAELLLARFALLACGCVCGTGRVLLNDESSNIHPGIDSMSFLFAILSKVDSYFRIMASRSDLACFFRAFILRTACDLVKGWNGVSVSLFESFWHGVVRHFSDPLLESCTSLSDPPVSLNPSFSSGLVGVASETGIVELLVLICLD